ncbi:pseudouridine synthase [Azorhizobium doebereinerae]|uniref:pseudouridine synthase n=1 Tax=Azorhizobium doebereinerae TaxID=281091 RepID=UPI0006840C13|nr:pseudouridine synthase [Azorhizobium doebereinerae]
MPPRKDKNRVPRAKRALPRPAPKEAERVAKVIARVGLGSRREIEEWITAGRVSVNGEVLTTPAVTVTPADEIRVDGEPLPERERTRLFLYHKPNGVVTTNRDPEGRTTLFELLPASLPRLVSIGRLDLNSEGLLLLTNDGGLARVLELPETGWLRRYRVRAKGSVNQAQLDALLKGITVDGIEYGSIEAVLDRVQGANVWITVALREGKNREVRNVLGALGLQVNRLIRVSYGPFQLGDVPEGGIEEVRTRVLRDQIGDDIAAAAGADFSGPLIEREVDETPRERPATVARPAADSEKPARAPRRAPQREIDPERAKPAPGKRRRDDDRQVVRVGTVADRKGREVKVERKITPPGEERGPRRGRADAAGRDQGFEAPARGRAPRREPYGDGPPRSREDRADRPREGTFRPRFNRDDASRGNREDAPRGRAPRGDFEDRPKRSFRSEGGSERPREGAARPRFNRDDASRGSREDAPRSRAPRGDFEDRPKRSFRSEGGSERPREGAARPRFNRDDASRGNREDAPRSRAPRGDFEDRPKRSFRSEGGTDRPREGAARPRFNRDEAPRRGPPRDGAPERRPREFPAGEDRSDRAPWREREESPRRPPRARPPREDGDRPRGERPAKFGKPAGERAGRAPGGAGGFRAERGPRGAAKDVGFGGAERSERPRSGGKPGGFKAGGFKAGGAAKGGPARGKGGPGGGKGGPARGGKPSGPRTRG